MTLLRPCTFFAAIVVLISLINTSVAAIDWDGPWKNTTSPSLNVYKFLKNFSNQRTRSHSMDRVIIDRYYQNGKYVGFTSFAAISWFGNVTQENIRKRLKKRIASVSGVTMDDAKEIRTAETYGVYIEKNGCAYVSFYTRAKDTGADNDTGDPDTTGVFKTCEGLTVPADQFINQILAASDDEKSAFSNAKIATIQTKRVKTSQKSRTRSFKSDSDEKICGLATTRDGSNWEQESYFIPIVEEARRRGLTLARCRGLTNRYTASKTKGDTKSLDQKAPHKFVRPLAIQWDGFPELIAGTISLNSLKTVGDVKITLPSNLGNCSGTFRFSPPEGIWAVSCSNGRTASGIYRPFGSGKGAEGKGKDDLGRKIRFTMGGKN